jgi:hypothetical protein
LKQPKKEHDWFWVKENFARPPNFEVVENATKKFDRKFDKPISVSNIKSQRVWPRRSQSSKSGRRREIRPSKNLDRWRKKRLNSDKQSGLTLNFADSRSVVGWQSCETIQVLRSSKWKNTQSLKEKLSLSWCLIEKLKNMFSQTFVERPPLRSQKLVFLQMWLMFGGWSG